MGDTLDERQAYLAMLWFLDELYTTYGFDQLGGLLGGMSLLPDGSPADPAKWPDWLRAVQRARNGDIPGASRPAAGA